MGKTIKQLNYGYLLEQERKITELTEKTFEKPLKTLDEATKFFMKTLDFALGIHEATKDIELKDYCKYYLTSGNALLHIIRTARKSLIQGYYGSVAVLIRTFINYLNLSIYIYHHPEDVPLLLSESQSSFKEDKKYKKKFHEYNIKKELEKLGYPPTDSKDSFAKLTHGSVWSSQVFGYKEVGFEENQYELNYSPKFSNLQASSYLSVLLCMPLDFSTYFMLRMEKINSKGFKQLKNNFKNINSNVMFAIKAVEDAYRFIKYAPDDIKNAILKRMESRKT